MKLSWFVVSGPDAAVAEACARLEVIADTYLSVAAAPQLALPLWMQGRQRVQSEIMQRTQSNLAQLKQRFAADSLQTEGAWSSVLRVPNTVPDEVLAMELLNRDGVLVDPGRLFGFPAAGYLVLSLLADEHTFVHGISCLSRRLEALSL